VTTKPLKLEGMSIAGIETAIEVPSLRLVLDMGRCTRTAVNYPLVVVSHGHLDHVGALAQHAARRAMLRMSEPTYVVPAVNADAVQRLFNAAGELDGHAIPRRVVPLRPGEELALSSTRFLRPFATFHPVPSQGYTVWERRTRLRDALSGTPGVELARLRSEGVDVNQSYAVPIMAFTGDTRVDVLESVEELRAVQTLIIEATFLDEGVSVADARSMGHVHLDELIERRALLSGPDIVLSHFSGRYEPDEVAHILARRLPPELREKVRVLHQNVPSLDDV
jgi:ribonuclease Z